MPLTTSKKLNFLRMRDNSAWKMPMKVRANPNMILNQIRDDVDVENACHLHIPLAMYPLLPIPALGRYESWSFLSKMDSENFGFF